MPAQRMNINAALITLALALFPRATGYSHSAPSPSLRDTQESPGASPRCATLMRLRGGGKVKSHSQSNMRKKLQRGGYRVDLMYQNDKSKTLLGRRRTDYRYKDYKRRKNDQWSIEKQPREIAKRVERVLGHQAAIAQKALRGYEDYLETRLRPIVAALRKQDTTRVYATSYDMVEFHKRVNKKARELRRGSWDCPECGQFNIRTKKVCPQCHKGRRPNDWLCYNCFEAENIRNTKACKSCGLVQEPRRDVLLLERAAAIPLPEVEDKEAGTSASGDAKTSRAGGKATTKSQAKNAATASA